MYTIYPVSVIDVARVGKKGLRKGWKNKNGVQISSRQEFSPFNLEIGTLCAEFFLRDAGTIFDPFAGWGERHLCCEQAGKVYLGYDKSPDAIKYAQEKYNVQNYLADSLEEEIPEHSGLLTCPPYWNLEKYAGDGLSKLKTWDDFIKFYKRILQRCSEKSSNDATYCIMVGDWRKAGKYYNLSYETENIMHSLGFETWDKVIVNQKKCIPYLRMGTNAKRFLYTAKVHQYLLVFKKKKL
mgnify:FL=1|tara:strand:+ start:6286 stop:7002 length:717 start_codon:yes stop_codon:yes gene_type:complete